MLEEQWPTFSKEESRASMSLMKKHLEGKISMFDLDLKHYIYVCMCTWSIKLRSQFLRNTGAVQSSEHHSETSTSCENSYFKTQRTLLQSLVLVKVPCGHHIWGVCPEYELLWASYAWDYLPKEVCNTLVSVCSMPPSVLIHRGCGSVIAPS